MTDIRFNNTFSLVGGFNISSGEPIDSRMFVNDIEHVTWAENWVKVKPYPGLIVSDPNGEVRVYAPAEGKTYTDPESWKKIGGGDVSFNGVVENDKVLNVTTDGKIGANIIFGRDKSFVDTTTGETVDSLVLKGKDDAVIGFVPVADFLMDGMLKNVELTDKDDKDNTGDFLHFSFSTLNEESTGLEDKEIYVDLSKFLNIFSAGDGIEISDGTIKLAGDYKDKLDSLDTTFVKNDDLASKLESFSFATTAYVDDSLTAYVKNDDFATKLESFSFATKEDVNTTLNTALAAFATIEYVDTTFIKNEELLAMTEGEISGIINPTINPDEGNAE